jgi:hypothetical protein
LTLIRIKNERFGFVVPLPLFILEDVIDSFSDLLSLVDKVARGSWKINFVTIAELLQETIEVLVMYGHWTMVDIEAEEVKVSITFY